MLAIRSSFAGSVIVSVGGSAEGEGCGDGSVEDSGSTGTACTTSGWFGSWLMTTTLASRGMSQQQMRTRTVVLLACSLILLEGCSSSRDVKVSNGCEVPVGLAFFGGPEPPAAPAVWPANTIVAAGTEMLLTDALPGDSGRVGLVRIEYPDGSIRILKIGQESGDPAPLTLAAALCSR